MHSEAATVPSQRRSSIDSLLRFFDGWARRCAPLPTLPAARSKANRCTNRGSSGWAGPRGTPATARLRSRTNWWRDEIARLRGWYELRIRDQGKSCGGADDISKQDRHHTKANGHNGEDVALTPGQGVNVKRGVCATDAGKEIAGRWEKFLFDCVAVAAAAFYQCSGGNRCSHQGAPHRRPHLRLRRRDAAQIRGD
jgi:hypothetical protein